MATITDRLRTRLLSRVDTTRILDQDYSLITEIVNDTAQIIAEADKRVEELAKLTGQAKGQLWAVTGMMAEDKELLEGLREHITHDATLIANFSAVFLQYDPKIWLEGLTIISPETRAQVLKKLDEGNLEAWLLALELEATNRSDESSRSSGQ